MLFHQEELSYISPYALSQFPLDPNIFLQKKIEIILLLRPNYICTIFAQVLCMLLASLLEKNYLVNNRYDIENTSPIFTDKSMLLDKP